MTGGDLPGHESEHALPDVRVLALVVGMRVVPVVLVHPPPEAQPDKEVAGEDAQQVVGPSAAPDLLVTAVVAEEGDLGEEQSQPGGGDQLQPRIADPGEHRPGAGEGHERGHDPEPVTRVATLEQPGVPDLSAEGGE